MWYLMFSPEDKLKNLAVGQNQDGRLEVFGTAADDTIWHAWQVTAGGGWSGWEIMFDSVDRLRNLVVAQNQDGRLEVFGTAADDTIWHAWQVTAGGWSGWQQFGAPEDRLHTLAAHRSSDGRLEVFGTAADDTIWVNYQTVVGGGWSGWQQFGAPEDRLRIVVPAVNFDGRTEVFGLAADDTIWHNTQTAGGWSGWQQFGAPEDRLHTLAAHRSSDGRLEVFGTAADDTIWVNYQTVVGGGWSGWQQFGAPEDRLRIVVPAVNFDGRTEVFGLAADDTIWHAWQVTAGGGWQGWELMFDSADRLRNLVVAQNQDGRLEVFGTAAGDTIWRNWQTSPNNGWRGERSPGRDTPWAVLLCKFNDNNIEPFPRGFYEREFTTAGAGYRNMVDYFEDVSHGHVDLRRSRVFGWFTLDKARNEYTGSGANPVGRQQLIAWAKDAATRAGVNLGDYYHVVVCMNVITDLFGGGGGVVCDRNSMQPSILGQEMGHGYGLDHSRANGSDDDYKDRWDIMSTWTNVFMAPHPEFGLIGPALNAWNMRGRGWLDESRVWKGNAAGFDETVEIRTLVRQDLPGLLAVELPGGFLAELRTNDGWDAAIPQSAILVHRFQNNHSYLMTSASGKQAILKGDAFQADVGRPGSPAPLRLDVLEIDRGAQVATLRLRLARPDSVVVPDVREMPRAQAAQAIRDAGLEPTFTGSTGSRAWVWSQSPKAGRLVDRGSRVTLQLRTGPIP